jgi:hypothetical protein
MNIVWILYSDKVSRMDSRCPNEDANRRRPTAQVRSMSSPAQYFIFPAKVCYLKSI